MVRTLAAAGLGLALIASTVSAQTTFGTDADRAAIRAHIESIFQAFIDATEMFARKPTGWANVGWHLAR